MSLGDEEHPDPQSGRFYSVNDDVVAESNIAKLARPPPAIRADRKEVD
jgi:hypothetical protein